MCLVKITDLTKRLGLSSRTLRYYEQVGHANAPCVDKKQKRISFQILNLFHIRSTRQLIHIDILVLNPADMLVGDRNEGLVLSEFGRN